MIIILVLAIFFWLGGYAMTVFKMSNTGLLASELEKLITPPKWLYYLCGAPQSKGYPRGTMRVAAFRAQMSGVLWLIYLIYSRIWETSQWENLVGLTLCLAIALVITSYISKNYEAKSR